MPDSDSADAVLTNELQSPEGGPLHRRQRRAGPLVHSSGALQLAGLCGYVLVQLLVVAGLTTPRYPDSVTYLTLSFTGRAVQLPTVPLLYSIFPNDGSRVFAQAVLAGLCWWWLSIVVAKLIRDRRVRIGSQGILLALGVVFPISSWNTTIDSESTMISLTAAIVAAWISYGVRPSWRRVGIALVLTLAWTLTRQANVVIGLMITAIALLSLLGRHRNWTKAVAALGLALISVLGLALVSQNHTVASDNVADIIQDRILPNASYTDWFIEHGMPYSGAVAAATGGEYGLALEAIPSFEAWLKVDGQSAYEHFLLSHLNYTLYDPLPYFSGELATLHNQLVTVYSGTVPNPTPSMLSPTADYGRYRSVLPSVVSSLLFDQGQAGDVFCLAAAAAVLYVSARRRHGRDPRQWVPMLLLATVIPQGYFVWLSGGVGELDRLSLIVAVSVRIALWTIVALALDHLLSPPPLPTNRDSMDATLAV